MASQYQITIQMSQQTVQTLLENGFALYGLHAVQTSAGGGLPTVWFRNTSLGLNTVVTWREDYQAFTSQSQIMPGAQIRMGASSYIQPGQQLQVTSPGGYGQVQQGGPPNAISILNSTMSPFTCGLALGQPEGGPAPIVALPLFGNMISVMVPVTRVFLMFSTMTTDPGTAVPQSSGSGILIDLTGSPSQTVRFDINTGWQAGPGAQVYPPNTQLEPLLLQ